MWAWPAGRIQGHGGWRRVQEPQGRPCSYHMMATMLASFTVTSMMVTQERILPAPRLLC